MNVNGYARCPGAKLEPLPARTPGRLAAFVGVCRECNGEFQRYNGHLRSHKRADAPAPATIGERVAALERIVSEIYNSVAALERWKETL